MVKFKALLFISKAISNRRMQPDAAKPRG